MTGQTIQRLLLIFLLLTAIPFLSISKSFAVAAYSATQTIYITNAGYSPSTAPINQTGNTFTLNNSITSNLLNTIVVQRNNIILDGAGFTVQGSTLSGSNGINLTQVSGITIQNITIKSFHNGIYLRSSTNNHITETTMSNNKYGIYLQSSSYNHITGSNLTQNTWAGIWLDFFSQNNNIAKNKLANTISSNFGGIVLRDQSDNNNILDNYITSNTRYGIYIENSASNHIYHNNFVDNLYQAYVDPLTSYTNTWDIGYPSGGNYWSDYSWLDIKNGPNQNQPGSDGIGDNPYTIDASNRDRFPLKNPWTPTYTNITVNTTQKPVIILSNTTITDITSTANTLNFNAAGTQTGYALITFPNVNNTAIQIRINGNPPISPFPTINTNGTHWFIYFEFHLSTQPITIIYDIPQLPVPIAPGGIITLILAMIMVLVGFSILRRYQNHSTVRVERAPQELDAHTSVTTQRTADRQARSLSENT